MTSETLGTIDAVDPSPQALVLGLSDAMRRSRRVLGRSRSLRRHMPSQASDPTAAQRSRSGCAIRSVDSSCARANLVATRSAVRRPRMDPADLVRPRALLFTQSAGRRNPMRRANQPDKVSAVPRPRRRLGRG